MGVGSFECSSLQRADRRGAGDSQLQVPVELVREVHATGKLPVVNFAAGGVATPADAALMMQLGVDGVFVGPSDLAAALGHLGNAAHPEVQRAIQHIFASAKKHGKPSGILAPVEADARRYLEWGATFVAVGSDLGVFRSATQKLADAFKK